MLRVLMPRGSDSLEDGAVGIDVASIGYDDELQTTVEWIMKIIQTHLAGLLIIEPTVYLDSRGYFLETWHRSRYAACDLRELAQVNLSYSTQGVLRGLHFQNPNPQKKLVQVLDGVVFDVAVDVRQDSPTFSRWFGATLSRENARQLLVPEGFAHGFCVMSTFALVAYKCSAEYEPSAEVTVAWNDPQIAIEWPISDPILSEKDAAAQTLKSIPCGRLPLLRPESNN